MRFKFLFEFRVLSTIVAVIIAVGATGFFAYQSMTEIVAAARKTAKPDEKLPVLKEIILDLSEAESSVKTFILTNDISYIGPFYQSALHIAYKFEQLAALTKNDPGLRAIADSLNSLVKQKFIVLNEIKTLQEINYRSKKNYHQNLEKQLLLTHQDKLIMDHIRRLSKEMELVETTAMLGRINETDQLAQRANFSITIITGIISIFLLALAFSIIRYAKKGREYNVALQKAKDETENLAKSKENFFIRMNHEIRTPINAILGFTELVTKSPLSKEQNQHLAIIKKSGEHLLTIANEILDLAKLEAGKITLEEIAFQPVELIEDTFFMLENEAEKKDLKYLLYTAEDIPPVLMGDPMRLKQILLNVLGNAIKFTEQGEVKLALTAIKKDEHSVCLNIKITDTGIGIAAQRLNEVFNEFEQAEDHITRKFGGTGLGLSITKKLCERLNGKIDIISEEGKGTAVLLNIPFLKGETPAITTKPDAVPEWSLLKNKRILIADDNEFNRLLLVIILSNIGITCDEALNGKMAIELLEKNSYDVILMDLIMPEMSGIEATTYIRQMNDPAKAGTPIIVLTAVGSTEVIGQAREAGADEYLGKPFHENELYEKLAMVLHLDLNEKKDSIPQKADQKGFYKLYELDDLYRMANNDQSFVMEMIQIFIRSTREGIQEIKTAQEQSDWENVANYAHKIAAPIRHLKAVKLLKLIKQIENDGRELRDIENIPSLILNMEEEASELIGLLEKEITQIMQPK